MKRLICIFVCCISLVCWGQESLLTKKIVYPIRITENSVLSLEKKDSITYNYIVNKRFFWEAMDDLFNDIKGKKLYLTTFEGDTIVWDTMINDLIKQLNKIDNRKYSAQNIDKVLENEIRAIKFMEEWTWNKNTMQIDKKIVAYCPIIQRDSVHFVEDNDFLNNNSLLSQKAFEYEIGWIWQNNNKRTNDTLLITRNIQYTIPIYNPKPYHWWESNLEAEYSIPFLETLINKTDSRDILCYESPDIPDAFTLPELEKRKKHSVSTTIFTIGDNQNEIERDTIINLTYNSDDIDYLRFGEEIIYDKGNNNFYKQVNYYAPIIRIFTSGGTFIGFYPLFYIRKD